MGKGERLGQVHSFLSPRKHNFSTRTSCVCVISYPDTVSSQGGCRGKHLASCSNTPNKITVQSSKEEEEASTEQATN